MAIPIRTGDQDGSIEKFARSEWAGAKVCYSPSSKTASSEFYRVLRPGTWKCALL